MNLSTSTARLRELGHRLRIIREHNGFTGLQMAERMNWHQSRLSRLETGKRSVSSIEVVLYTSLCGVVGQEQADLVDLANQPDDYRLMRRDGAIPDRLPSLTFNESTARTIECFQPILLPAIVQTDDYAHAVFEASSYNPSDIAEHVRVRATRRVTLTRVGAARCSFYIHENALRIPVGEPLAMHNQMQHLLAIGTLPDCEVRVVPSSAGSAGLANGAFDIFTFFEGVPMVYLEGQTTSLFIEAEPDLAAYRSTLNRIARIALTEAESRAFIEQLASNYESTPTSGQQ